LVSVVGSLNVLKSGGRDDVAPFEKGGCVTLQAEVIYDTDYVPHRPRGDKPENQATVLMSEEDNP